MGLDADQVQRLLAMVADTRDEEIDCGHCLAGMAEFVEVSLLGTELTEALARIEDHLTTCPECSEEYALLHELLREGADS